MKRKSLVRWSSKMLCGRLERARLNGIEHAEEGCTIWRMITTVQAHRTHDLKFLEDESIKNKKETAPFMSI